MSPIGQAIKTTYAYALLRNFEVKRRGPKELADWERKGRPMPPPHIVKQRVLVEYAQIEPARGDFAREAGERKEAIGNRQ